MISSDASRNDAGCSSHRDIPVAVLGATGAVGQRFIQLLENHPWFRVVAVAASEKSCGRRYADACSWKLATPIPPAVADLPVTPLDPARVSDYVQLVFSALPSDVAREVEPVFAEAGMAVSSNASAFRGEPDVPVLLADVNADHVRLLEIQRERRGWKGVLITNPNCTTSGIALVLKPLHDAFGVQSVMATSMQAISGAGYPGVPSFDILGSIVPWISGEEEKIEHESNLLLGSIDEGWQAPAGIAISAHANRVPVLDGHTVCLSIGFSNRGVEPGDVARALAAFADRSETAALPSAPRPPIRVLIERDRPQPRLDCSNASGMQIAVGRIRTCNLLDIRLVLAVHNTIRGAAGGSILNAELLVHEGWVS